MNGIQLDLFTFAAMQTQEKNAEAKSAVLLKNFINDGKYPLPTVKSERIAANLKAIRLLKSLSEERPLEYDEQITLSHFTGWGGLTDVFMEDDPHFAELKELLTKEEYETAESSMLDSYYTPENIIEFMWTLARQKFGIKTGKVAELGCGTGNFIGYAPMQKGYQFTGVEIDKISGNIAKRLYPESTIHINSLEKVKLSNNFDLVIGNVPFGRFAPYDPQFRSYNSWNLHNYFIAKALDLLKDGGHLVVLTSSSTMDQPGSMANILMQKAGVVEAYRLPKTTFAGTEVVADILIIKKGFTEDLSGNLKTVETSDNTGTVEINSYFAKHPEHIFGTLSKTGRMYGKTDTTTVLPGEKSLDECFSEIMAEKKNTVVESAIEKSSSPETDLFGNVVIDTPKSKTVNIGEIPETVAAPIDAKEYTIFCTQHGVYQVIDGEGRRMKDRKGEDLSAKEIKKITSFVAIKETLNRLIAAQLDFNASDFFIEQLRTQLKWKYEDHVARYDVLSNRAMHRFCTEDPEYNKVAAIENCKKVSVVNKAGIKTTKNVYEPGDILFKRTQYPWKEPDHADDIVAAGLISNAYRNCIDLSYIGQMTGKTPEEAKIALLASKEYFFDPATKQIMLKSRYLSGNIKRKITEARLHGLEDNVAALQEVLPKPLTIEDIDFALGAFWLPQSVVEKWVAKDLNGKVEIIYDEESDSWKVNADWENRNLINQYNLDRMTTLDLLELILNLRDPIIHTKVWDHDRGQFVDVVDKEATLTARQYKNEMFNRFHDFVMDDRELAAEIEEVYNETFNNHVLQKYDLPPFDVYPGASSIVDGKPFILREHQKRAVSRCIQGNTLLAHAVGAGKTAVMITAAMELIRLKLATKTMIVVQNATLQQFAEFAPKLYPTANILVATKQDLVKDKRKRFLGRIATGKWDIIIIAQSSFNMIEDNPDLIREKYQEELEAMEKSEAARDTGRRLNKRERKAQEQRKRSLKSRLDRLEDRHAVEDMIYFDELGIDCIFIDEVHSYKRNFFVTKMSRVKGLDNGASQKAFSLTLKLNHIREKTAGRNIYTATGTPVTNTLAELWNMVRYVSPETLEDFHVDTFDRFASTFALSETALEINAAGRLKMVTRFAKYTNVVELSKMFRSCADVILPEDLKGIPKPPIKGGHPEQIKLPRTPQVSSFMDYLADLYSWFEKLDNSEKKHFCHIPLMIYGFSRKATIDLRLVAENAVDDPGSKLNVCVEKILEKYRDYDSIKGAQVVFSDLYQLSCGKIAYFDVFREIKRKLVDRGIPADEIAIINDYKTDKQRQELFDLVNKGDVRVIMGTTQRLGTGVNMQERLAVEHDLDAPFRPADAEQRTGRLVRQGNILPEVEVLRYGMEETLDAGMYQILTRKQKFINDALKGRRRNMDELNDSAVDYASFSAQISGNPMLMRKVELETRLRELQALEYQFRRSIRRDEDLKAELQRAIPHLEEDIIKLKELAAHPFSTEFPEIELNGIRLDGTTEYKVKQLTAHMMQKGLFPALQKAKTDLEDTVIPAGFAKINSIEIELNAHCPVENYRVREDKLTVRYHLTGHSFYNRKIKLGSEVTTGNGLITSLKSILAHKAEEAISETDQLKLNRQRLQQLLESDGQKVFKYADERIQAQKELDQILYELNEKDLLHEDKFFSRMPQLNDYLDLGVELISQDAEVSDDEDEEEKEESVKMSA